VVAVTAVTTICTNSSDGKAYGARVEMGLADVARLGREAVAADGGDDDESCSNSGNSKPRLGGDCWK
jgi:hypothetical protein